MLRGTSKNKSKPPKVRKNRFKKNARQQRQRWIGRMMLGLKMMVLMTTLLAISALFMMGYAAVTRSDYFRIETIHISGNQRLDRNEILAKAGMQRGDNLLALNLRLVRQRLLDHPWIESARISRDIPDTIRIEVWEHVPLAVIDWGRRFLVDEAGRIFKKVEADDPRHLPLISGLGLEDVGMKASRPGPDMQSVVEVLQLSRRSSSPIAYADIERIEADPDLGISLTLKDDQHLIKLGFGDYEDKYERFRQLRLRLKRTRQRDCQVVDLTIPDRVVVRLEAGGTNG